MNDSNTEPRFDPRHDPIYQRGYQAAEGHPAAAVPDVAGRTDQGALAPHEPVALGNPVGQAAGDQAATGPGDDVHPVIPDVTPVAETQRNPYFLALWITAAALIVAGVALEWRSVAMADYGYASAPGEVPLEAIIQQLTWVIAPIMITVGALTIIALLFWRGVHWRPSGESAHKASALRRLGPWS